MDCLIDTLAARYSSPADFIRSTYKYTDCGAAAGMLVEYTIHVPSARDPYAEAGGTTWLYEYDARRLTWDQLRDGGAVLAVSVSSIVEGIDATTTTHEVCAQDCADAEDFDKRWAAAVDGVEAEADELWRDTHGCAWCDVDPSAVPAGADPNDDRLTSGDYKRLNPACPVCVGDGVHF